MGVDDLIIVDTGDALLISKKGSSQRVKEVVSMLDDGLKNIHLKAYRPWGSYTVLEDKPGYKIKKIEVAPGKRLSLQKHFHRRIAQTQIDLKKVELVMPTITW